MPTTFSATPQTTTLLENVIPYTDGTTPFFRYYGYSRRAPAARHAALDPGPAR